MDIKRAKQEIEHAVKAYLAVDDTGTPLIPPIRQRPILLMGPPGVGKTHHPPPPPKCRGPAIYPPPQFWRCGPQRNGVHNERDHCQRV